MLPSGGFGVWAGAEGEGRRLEFRCVAAEQLQSHSRAGKLFWHPKVLGAEVAMLLESMSEALQQEHSQEAVDLFRQMFAGELFAAVPLIVGFAHVAEFRNILIRDKWFGDADPETPE